MRSWLMALALSVSLLSAPVSASRASGIVDFPVCQGTSGQLDPSLSGDFVAWEDYRDGFFDIYGMHVGQTDFAVTKSVGANMPAVGPGLVVWADPKGSHLNPSNIYSYDLGTGLVSQVSPSQHNQVFPAIDGQKIVWEDERNGSTLYSGMYLRDIYGYDLNTHAEFRASSRTKCSSPDISGNIIVWEDIRNMIPYNWDIYGYNISTATEFPIATGSYPELEPKVSGNIVVWLDHRNNNADLYGKDLSTGIEFPICTNSADQQQPDIDGNIVVWVDGRSGHTDVYGYDLTTGQEFVISDYPSEKFQPAISGNLVVWQDDRNGGDLDIYGAYIPEPATLAFLCAGASVILRRRDGGPPQRHGTLPVGVPGNRQGRSPCRSPAALDRP